ncbi:MAG: hypothetical protein LBT33_10440 [Spirochaetia bacterium]|jgi:hypothetical protein|nr:hypothetical protein [Spirochaetia bacterium]
MSLQLRKFFLTAGAVLSLAFFLLFCGTVAFLIQYASHTEEKVFTVSLALNLVDVGCVSFFSVAGGFGFRRLFRRTSALEIFFFLAFVLSLSFDALKIVNYYFTVAHVPAFYGTIITRAVYFGFFLGLFFLFTGSLFSGDLTYQKLGTVLGLVVVFSLALVYSLPVDETVLNANLLYRVGGGDYILLVRFGLEALTLLGFGRSAYLLGSAEQWFICGAVALLITGRELLFFLLSPPTVALGTILMIGGALLFSKKVYAKHLWI